MIYLLVGILAVIVWLATSRTADPVRRVGLAIAAIGLALAVLMSWMAFPFLVLAGAGGVVVAMSHLRERSA